jgi:hypothetical protein
MIPTDTILEDAEIAAIYLRALLAKDVPMMAAVSLTSSYVSSQQITRASNQEPPIPGDEWKRGEPG